MNDNNKNHTAPTTPKPSPLEPKPAHDPKPPLEHDEVAGNPSPLT